MCTGRIEVFDLQTGHGKSTGLELSFIREILSIPGLTIRERGSPGNGARFEILVPAGKFRGFI
jgi:hypothetical protein